MKLICHISVAKLTYVYCILYLSRCLFVGNDNTTITSDLLCISFSTNFKTASLRLYWKPGLYTTGICRLVDWIFSRYECVCTQI